MKPPAATDDPFAEFAHWRKRDDWPQEQDWELTGEQREIVAQNVASISHRQIWDDKVEAFDALLAEIDDDDERAAKRDTFEIRFDRHDFGAKVPDFRKIRFPCATSFFIARFGRDADFASATFSGNADFMSAKFRNGAKFPGARFHTGTTFAKAEFRLYAYFYRAEFGEFAVFVAGDFDGPAVFTRTSFSGGAAFRGATFSGNADFMSATFSGDADFESATFSDTAMSASDMVVKGDLRINSTFGKTCNFRRLRVDGTADFSGSAFAIVPDFRDAKLDRPPEVARMAIAPSPLNARRFGFFASINGEETVSKDAPNWSRADDVTRFRKLKAMALAANDHEKDGEFFAMEMLAKRGTETTTFWGLLFNTLYWKLSNFGQSFMRPIVGLVASFFAFCLAYIYLIGFSAEPWDRLRFAAYHSLKNAVPLIGTLRRFAVEPANYESWYDQIYSALNSCAGQGNCSVSVSWLIGLGVTQNIIGLVLLFLLLLALRNKFRLK